MDGTSAINEEKRLFYSRIPVAVKKIMHLQLQPEDSKCLIAQS